MINEEEQVIRDWLAGQVNPATGAPLRPAERLSQPIPRRQVVAVVQTLVGLLDEARRAKALEEAGPDLVFSTAPAPEGIDTDCLFAVSGEDPWAPRISIHVSRRAINAQVARSREGT